MKKDQKDPELHPEILAEIDSADGIVFDNFIGLACSKDGALANNVSVVTNA